MVWALTAWSPREGRLGELIYTSAVPVHTHTDHSHISFPGHSGTITLATLTSLLPTLVRRFAGSILPLRSLLDCQVAYARLATSKLPQPSVNLIDVAASPSILCSCVCTSCCETCTLVPAVLVRDSWSRIAIQKAGYQGDSAHQVLGLGHVETRCRGWFVQLDMHQVYTSYECKF